MPGAQFESARLGYVRLGYVSLGYARLGYFRLLISSSRVCASTTMGATSWLPA